MTPFVPFLHRVLHHIFNVDDTFNRDKGQTIKCVY